MTKIKEMVGEDQREYIKSLDRQIAAMESRLAKLRSYRDSYPGQNRKREQTRKKEIENLEQDIRNLEGQKTRALKS